MDVSVKGLEPDVVQRLSEQAEIEGVSAQEWMRQALRRTASLLTPTELANRAAQRKPVSHERYIQIMEGVTATRTGKTAKATSADVRRRRR